MYTNRLGLVVAVFTGGLFAADNTLTHAEKADGWVLLFDGKTLNGWTSADAPASPASHAPTKHVEVPPSKTPPAPAVGSNPKACSTPSSASAPYWEIVGGTIQPCGDKLEYLTTTADYRDFVLALDFKTSADANSGVFLKSIGGGGGYQVQIWDLHPLFTTGALMDVAKTDKPYKILPDQWNHFEITADGDHLMVALNGVKTLDIHDSGFGSDTGRIRLEYHKFPIEFKNVKLKVFKH